jgi:hypothetical protein
VRGLGGRPEVAVRVQSILRSFKTFRSCHRLLGLGVAVDSNHLSAEMRVGLEPR